MKLKRYYRINGSVYLCIVSRCVLAGLWHIEPIEQKDLSYQSAHGNVPYKAREC
jgi:hypothetical protein